MTDDNEIIICKSVDLIILREKWQAIEKLISETHFEEHCFVQHALCNFLKCYPCENCIYCEWKDCPIHGKWQQ